jgi:hypothetical protein
VTANTYFLFIHPTYQWENAWGSLRSGGSVGGSGGNCAKKRLGDVGHMQITREILRTVNVQRPVQHHARGFTVIISADRGDKCRKTTQHVHSDSKRTFFAV